jgi:hypothetical protein
MVKKSLWVSFCGWAFLGCWSFVVGAVLVDSMPHRNPFLIPPVIVGVGIWLSFPCLIMWALGSIVHRLRVGSAKMSAAAIVEAQRKAGVLPVPRMPAAPKLSPVIGPYPVCTICAAAAAVVRCVACNMELCMSCFESHKLTSHGAPGAAGAGASR